MADADGHEDGGGGSGKDNEEGAGVSGRDPDDLAGHVDGNNAEPLIVNGWPRWPSVLQRYYAPYRTSNEQSLHVHSNGVCVLGVAPTHPALQPPLSVVSIAYRSDNKNVMQTEVHGKKKAGAVFVTPRDMVCELKLSDGSSVTLYACIRGHIIEINHRLIDRPELLGTPEGYVAILMPKVMEKKSIGESLKEFERETPLSVESTNAKRKAEGRPPRSQPHGKKPKREKSPCWTFQQKGHCNYGDNCRFSHGDAAPTKVEAAETVEIAVPAVPDQTAVPDQPVESGEAAEQPAQSEPQAQPQTL